MPSTCWGGSVDHGAILDAQFTFRIVTSTHVPIMPGRELGLMSPGYSIPGF